MNVKRKMLAFVLLCCLIITTVGGLFACSSSVRSSSLGSLNDKTSFGKKYYRIVDSKVIDKEKYFIINSDNKAELIYLYRYINNEHPEYNKTVSFVAYYTWEAVDESSIVLINNGFKYKEDNFNSDEKPTGCYTIGVSKDVLVVTLSSSIHYYVCEDFLDEIPNFMEQI